MAYGDFQDLTRRTASDKMLHYKAFNIPENRKYDEYKWGLASMVYKYFDEKTSASDMKNKNMSNKELAEELHQLLENFKNEKYTHPL